MSRSGLTVMGYVKFQPYWILFFSKVVSQFTLNLQFVRIPVAPHLHEYVK